ncbi:DgyrCDS11237 [Dimorphilus gyrociliatus]|uniref:Transcription initiation factor IIE subunit beta n=1 Tax=Dimorphilus gyrociliatus TaxID=2664684 RepID=A0A7I8W7K3_9ANNE|nr:DgyrCDS11237 [Dimorphilus gyrociliatus]
MNAELLRERQRFLSKAKSLPVVEKRQKRSKPDENLNKTKKKIKSEKATPQFDYKTSTGGSQLKFSILSKIVRYMRDRHLQGDSHALNIEDILEETHQTGISQKITHWLENEALPNNPKIDTEEGKLFKFRPKYPAKDKKSLRKLMEKYDREGMGGILEDDIKESVPNSEKVLKSLGDLIICVKRPHDKQKVLFYNDKSVDFKLDENFQKLWRSVPLEGMDEKKIDEFLTKQGIQAMMEMDGPNQNSAFKRKQKKKGGNKRKKTNYKSHNEHMGDILKDFSSNN